LPYIDVEKEEYAENIPHRVEELARFNRASDQDTYRLEIIVKLLQERGYDLAEVDAFVGRGWAAQTDSRWHL
jgi:butyrate kinase